MLDEYGFLSAPSSGRQYNKRTPSRTPEWVTRTSPPDPRRFAIALPGSAALPAAFNETTTTTRPAHKMPASTAAPGYFNPLLRNPESGGEYVANVRSAAGSGIQRENKVNPLPRRVPTGQLNAAPIVMVPTISAALHQHKPDTTATIAKNHHNNNNQKRIPTGKRTNNNSSSSKQLQFSWDFKHKSLLGFCILVAVVFALCVATALILIYTGKYAFSFNYPPPPHSATLMYGSRVGAFVFGQCTICIQSIS